jgi:hypothetical protein
MIEVKLTISQAVVDGKTIFADEMSDNGVAVADRLARVDDIRELTAWCGRGVEDMVVAKLLVSEPQECKNLQAEGVVVGDAKQRRIRIEGEHLTSTGRNGS